MGLIKRGDKVLYQGPVAYTSYNNGWNNSMAQYYPYLSIYIVSDNELKLMHTVSIDYDNPGTPQDLVIELDADLVPAYKEYKRRIEIDIKNSILVNGMRVKVMHGTKKCPTGTEATIFWLGKTSWGNRAGIELDNGDKVFIDQLNLKGIQYKYE